MKKTFFRLIFLSLLSIILISCSVTNINVPSNDNNSESNNNNNIGNDEVISNKDCRIFLFDSKDLTLYYLDKELVVKDNALVTALTKELQTNMQCSTLINLTDKVNISSAKLSKNKDMLTIVFDKPFTDYMILGSSTESGLISSLVNTYGYNYGVDKVAIYFDDTLYTGLKGSLSEGYFNTDYSNSKSLSSKNTTTERDCRLFFYSGNDDCFYYVTTNLKITENALVSALTNALKSPPSDSFLCIPDLTNVINANLSNDTLTINLSKEYYNILSKVGSGSEASLLQSLAMTYGYNYNVDNVIILIDNKPYKGSHVEFEEGQTVNFDINNSSKYN